jgi:nucleoside-diphosphate-sugar epimerase
MKKILVTGCAGFIGSNFVTKFKKRYPKVEIVGIDDFSTGRREALDKTIKFYEGSITDKKLVQEIFKSHKPEYVFHFAARPRVAFSVEQPYLTTEVNIGGTVALLEAARDHKVKRFIYSSSSSIYGAAKKRPTPETEPANPRSPYALQKYTGEVFCRLASKLYGLDTVSLRYHNVFGPGQYGDSPYSNVVSAWLESIYFPKTKKGFKEGDGKQAKDMTFVDDVVEANILAMKYPKKFNGEAFNIAMSLPKPLSINEIAKKIEKVTGKKLTLEQRPPRPGDVRFSHADISKARRVLGFKPVTDFDSCLRKTVQWFEKRLA